MIRMSPERSAASTSSIASAGGRRAASHADSSRSPSTRAAMRAAGRRARRGRPRRRRPHAGRAARRRARRPARASRRLRCGRSPRAARTASPPGPGTRRARGRRAPRRPSAPRCRWPPGPSRMSKLSVSWPIVGSPSPMPGLSERGTRPLPSSTTQIASCAVERLDDDAQQPRRARPTNAWTTTFVAASETASAMSRLELLGHAESTARAVTARRTCETAAGSAGKSRCQRATSVSSIRRGSLVDARSRQQRVELVARASR